MSETAIRVNDKPREGRRHRINADAIANETEYELEIDDLAVEASELEEAGKVVVSSSENKVLSGWTNWYVG